MQKLTGEERQSSANSTTELTNKSPAPTTYEQAEKFGLAKVAKSPWQSFILSIFAGAFIAIAFVFYVTVTTGSTGGCGMTRFIGGLWVRFSLHSAVGCGVGDSIWTVLTTHSVS